MKCETRGYFEYDPTRRNMKLTVSIGCLLLGVSFACAQIQDVKNTLNDLADGINGILNIGKDWAVTGSNGQLVRLDAPFRKCYFGRTIQANVRFYLHTRNTGNVSQEIFVNASSPDTHLQNFDAGKPTVFVTHGWQNNKDDPACTRVVAGYLDNHDVNVIVVDWSGFAKCVYFAVVERLETAGNYVAEMINYLQRKVNLDPSETTLVGHGLGAHLMGIAASRANGTIKAIFGLDPTNPSFKHHANPPKRLSISNAKHVQVIHTNGGYLGIKESNGHSDYYVNGGERQEGCATHACSHSRAWEYFAESLGPGKSFRGHSCLNMFVALEGICSQEPIGTMGGLNPTSTGIFYIPTNRTSPYATGRVGAGFTDSYWRPAH